MKFINIFLVIVIFVSAAMATAGEKMPAMILTDRQAEHPHHRFEDVAIVQGDGVHDLVVRFSYAIRDTFIALIPLPKATTVTTVQPAFFVQLQSYVTADTLRDLWETMIPDYVDVPGMCVSRGPRFGWKHDFVQTPGFSLTGSQVFVPHEQDFLQAWCAERGVAVENNYAGVLAEWRLLGFSVVALEFVARNVGSPPWRLATGDGRTEPVRIRYYHDIPIVPGGKSNTGVMYVVSDEPVFPQGLPSFAAAVRILADDAAKPWFDIREFRSAPYRGYRAEAAKLHYSLQEDLVADADFPWLHAGEASLTVIQFGGPPLGYDYKNPFNCRELEWVPWNPAAALQDSVRNTRAAAAIALGMNDFSGASDQLTNFLWHAAEADEAVPAALWALRQRGLAGLHNLVARWAESKDWNVRVMVADCYAVLRGQTAWEYLVEGMSSPLGNDYAGPTLPVADLGYRCRSWLRNLRDPGALPVLRARHEELLNREFRPSRNNPDPPPKLRRGLHGLLAACGDEQAWSEIRTSFLREASRADAAALALDGQLLRTENAFGSGDSDYPTSVQCVHRAWFYMMCADLYIEGPARQEMVRELAHSDELPRSCTLELLSQLEYFGEADEDLLRRLWHKAPVYREGAEARGANPIAPEIVSKTWYDRTALACLNEFGRRGMVDDLWSAWKQWHRHDSVVAETIVMALGQGEPLRVHAALREYMDRWWESVLVGDRERELAEVITNTGPREGWPPFGFTRAMTNLIDTRQLRQAMISEVEDEKRPLLWRLIWLDELATRVYSPDDISRWESLLASIAAAPEADSREWQAIIERVKINGLVRFFGSIRTYPKQKYPSLDE